MGTNGQASRTRLVAGFHLSYMSFTQYDVTQKKTYRNFQEKNPDTKEEICTRWKESRMEPGRITTTQRSWKDLITVRQKRLCFLLQPGSAALKLGSVVGESRMNVNSPQNKLSSGSRSWRMLEPLLLRSVLSPRCQPPISARTNITNCRLSAVQSAGMQRTPSSSSRQ